MKKATVYESWKKDLENKKFTKDNIKNLYNLNNKDFDYYCDFVSSRNGIEDRSSLKKLMKSIENDEIGIVYINSVNHISRKIEDICAFLEIAKKHDCKVVDKTGKDLSEDYKQYSLLKEICEVLKEENMIEIEINNEGTLRISQTDSDKARAGIGVEHVDSYGEVYRRDLIDEGDFVMLINYYCYVKDNDIKDEFINPNGANNKEDIVTDIEK